MASQIESALESVEKLGGWRACLSLSSEAVDAEEIVGALPWAEGGVARPGTEVRLIADGYGRLVVITGGALSNEEGTLLFDIRDKLVDVLKSAYIVPPQSAAPELIARMYLSGLAPSLPTKKLPDPRGYWVVASGFLILVPYLRLIAGLLGLVFVAAALRKQTQLNDIKLDPEYIVAIRWAATLPQRMGH